MIKLKHLLMEMGEAAGNLELIKTTPDAAELYGVNAFKKKGLSLKDEIPNFMSNYKISQKLAGIGKTQRKDMPVIDEKDVKDFQMRLQKGFIDLNSPYAKPIKGSKPFPQGLSGDDASDWLKNGLPVSDNAKQTDDVVKVNKASISVNKLKPIQRQIYFDKAINTIASFGASKSLAYIKTTTFICSNDNYIIDGHHRFLSAMLIDPSAKINVLKINLPLSILLPMSLSYTDAVGNYRNL